VRDVVAASGLRGSLFGLSRFLALMLPRSTASSLAQPAKRPRPSTPAAVTPARMAEQAAGAAPLAGARLAQATAGTEADAALKQRIESNRLQAEARRAAREGASVAPAFNSVSVQLLGDPADSAPPPTAAPAPPPPPPRAAGAASAPPRRVVDFGGSAQAPRRASSPLPAPPASTTVVADTSSGRLVLTGDTFAHRDTIIRATTFAGFKRPAWNESLSGWFVDLGAEEAVLQALRAAGAHVIDASMSKALTEAMLSAQNAQDAASKAREAAEAAGRRASSDAAMQPVARSQPAPAGKAGAKAPSRVPSAPSESALRACILQMLLESDLKTVSRRQVREAAARAMRCDLSAYKRLVNRCIEELFSLAEQQQLQRRRASAPASTAAGEYDSPIDLTEEPGAEQEVIDLCSSPAPSPRAPRSDGVDNTVAAIADMGYPLEAAKRAVSQAGPSVEAALDWLSAYHEHADAALDTVPADAPEDDDHPGALAAAASAAAERASSAAAKLQRLQEEKSRRQEEGRAAMARAQGRGRGGGRAAGRGRRSAGGYGGGELVYAGDVVGGRGGAVGGWEGMGAMNMGGMDDYFSI